MTHCYTIMCEYDGGSYLHQVRAPDVHTALLNWAKLVEIERPFGVASSRVALIAAETPIEDEEKITPVKGLENVWCWTAADADELILTTIVQSS